MEKSYQGLSAEEVLKLTKQGKVNKSKKKISKSVLTIITDHLLELPNLIIFIAVLFLIFYRAVDDAILISLIIFVNFIVSVVQEVQAREALKRISLVADQPLKVIRSGEEVEIRPNEVLLGEVIKLESGSSIIVDGEVLSSKGLYIDESALTGESDYKRKDEGDKVLSGTFVVSGQGFYQAQTIGDESFAGKLTNKARKYSVRFSPLQQQVNWLVQMLTILTLVMIGALFITNHLVLNMPEVELIDIIVSIVSSMIPQGIIITLTIAFMIGAVRMYRQKILVQRASAVETLANIKVLCLDKTGTITKNILKTKEVVEFAPTKDIGFVMQLASFALENSVEKNKTAEAIENYLSEERPDSLAGGRDEFKYRRELVFNSRNKYSGVELESDGQIYQVVFAASEIGGELIEKTAKDKLIKAEEELSSKGQRNLVMLYRKLDSPSNPDDKDYDWVREALDKSVRDFQLAVVFSIVDEFRPGAREIIESFIKQGVKPVIISGDGPNTLRAIIAKLELKTLGKITTGAELDEAKASGAEQLRALILKTDVFARVSPEQKQEIVKIYRKDVGRTAMVGDGVNDVLAIKEADLGISLGTGSAITKSTADVILLDDDLGRLANVISEGRKILEDMLRASQLMVTKNVYSAVAIILAILLFLPFPFNFRGLAVLAFFNNNVPILFILADKSRPKTRHRFMRELLKFSLLAGGLIGIMTIGIILIFMGSRDVDQIQAIILAFLLFVGTINSLIVYNRSFSPLKALFSSWYIVVAVINYITYVLMLEITLVTDFLQLHKLTHPEWLVTIGLGIIYFALVSVFGTLLFRNNPIFKAN